MFYFFFSDHFCCWQCDVSLTGARYILRDEHPFCIRCYEEVFANTWCVGLHTRHDGWLNCLTIGNASNFSDECGKAIGIDSKVSGETRFKSASVERRLLQDLSYKEKHCESSTIGYSSSFQLALLFRARVLLSVSDEQTQRNRQSLSPNILCCKRTNILQ